MGSMLVSWTLVEGRAKSCIGLVCVHFTVPQWSLGTSGGQCGRVPHRILLQTCYWLHLVAVIWKF